MIEEANVYKVLHNKGLHFAAQIVKQTLSGLNRVGVKLNFKWEYYTLKRVDNPHSYTHKGAFV